MDIYNEARELVFSEALVRDYVVNILTVEGFQTARRPRTPS